MGQSNSVVILPVVYVRLQGPCDVVWQWLTDSLDHGAGDTVHLAPSDDLGVGEAECRGPDPALVLPVEGVEVRGAPEVVPL